MVVLRLPIPPSVNNLFANIPGVGRVKTKAYRTWRTEAGWALKLQKPEAIAGAVEVSLLLKRTRGDLDNLLKPILDLIVEHGVIQDDRFIEALHVRWATQGDGAMVTIEGCA